MTTTTTTRFVCLYARDDIRIEAREDAPLAPGEIRVNVHHVGICDTELHVTAEFGPSAPTR